MKKLFSSFITILLLVAASSLFSLAHANSLPPIDCSLINGSSCQDVHHTSCPTGTHEDTVDFTCGTTTQCCVPDAVPPPPINPPIDCNLINGSSCQDVHHTSCPTGTHEDTVDFTCGTTTQCCVPDSIPTPAPPPVCTDPSSCTASTADQCCSKTCNTASGKCVACLNGGEVDSSCRGTGPDPRCCGTNTTGACTDNGVGICDKANSCINGGDSGCQTNADCCGSNTTGVCMTLGFCQKKCANGGEVCSTSGPPQCCGTNTTGNCTGFGMCEFSCIPDGDACSIGGTPCCNNETCTGGVASMCSGNVTPAPTEPGPPSPPCLQEDANGQCISVDAAIGTLATDPSGFVSSIFGVLLGISGAIALLIIMFAGYRLMTSQGDPEKIQAAKEQITAGIVGLLFLIFSFVILSVIGVDLLHIPGFSG